MQKPYLADLQLNSHFSSVLNGSGFSALGCFASILVSSLLPQLDSVISADLAVTV